MSRGWPRSPSGLPNAGPTPVPAQRPALRDANGNIVDLASLTA